MRQPHQFKVLISGLLTVGTAGVVTAENLARYTNRCFNHIVWRNGTNYSDIFLNINKRGLLRLKPDDTSQIVNLRTWQLMPALVGRRRNSYRHRRERRRGAYGDNMVDLSVVPPCIYVVRIGNQTSSLIRC